MLFGEGTGSVLGVGPAQHRDWGGGAGKTPEAELRLHSRVQAGGAKHGVGSPLPDPPAWERLSGRTPQAVRDMQGAAAQRPVVNAADLSRL